jgi:hypothetical protein
MKASGPDHAQALSMIATPVPENQPEYSALAFHSDNSEIGVLVIRYSKRLVDLDCSLPNILDTQGKRYGLTLFATHTKRN